MTAASDLAIRLRRAAFNQALAAADLSSIAALLTPRAVLVTGTDSAVLADRKAQLAAWKQEFAAPDRTIYTRTPEQILLSPTEPIALEQGAWIGVSASTKQAVASGAYSAKWREIGGDWFIEAELYLTLS